jgi:hypothetical protein
VSNIAASASGWLILMLNTLLEAKSQIQRVNAHDLPHV